MKGMTLDARSDEQNGRTRRREEDQGLITYLMEAYPVEGPGLCYLLGWYREAGHSQDAALALALQSLRHDEGKG
jgi:hypothetical protein